MGRYGLFGVIIWKDGGGSDNRGVMKGGLSGLTDSIIGALVGRAVEGDAQFQFHCCCCCQVQVFQALGFSILFSVKKYFHKMFTLAIGNLQTCNRTGDIMITKCFIRCYCCYI